MHVFQDYSSMQCCGTVTIFYGSGSGSVMYEEGFLIQYMKKCASILSLIRKPLVIYDFAPAPRLTERYRVRSKRLLVGPSLGSMDHISQWESALRILYLSTYLIYLLSVYRLTPLVSPRRSQIFTMSFFVSGNGKNMILYPFF